MCVLCTRLPCSTHASQQVLYTGNLQRVHDDSSGSHKMYLVSCIRRSPSILRAVAMIQSHLTFSASERSTSLATRIFSKASAKSHSTIIAECISWSCQSCSFHVHPVGKLRSPCSWSGKTGRPLSIKLFHHPTNLRDKMERRKRESRHSARLTINGNRVASFPHSTFVIG